MFWRKKKQQKNDDFICAECGQTHSGWPALTFRAPDPYLYLTEVQRKNQAQIDTDFCIIEQEGQTGRFIRVVMIQKVNDSKENLEYGVWVSLSQQSYQDYWDNFDQTDREGGYFGWLYNVLPPYKNLDFVPMDIHLSKDGQRPIIYPHQDHDHPLVHDFYNGISSHEAQKRVDNMIKNKT